MSKNVGVILMSAAALAMVLGCAGAPKKLSAPIEFLEDVTAEPGGDPSSNCEGTWRMNDGVGRWETFSGGGFGCWVALSKDAGLFDAGGAARVVLTLTVKDGGRFHFFMSEDGVGPADAGSFEGERGADGEQYSSPELIGDGTKKEYALEIAELTKVTFIGNQAGNDRADCQALQVVGLYTPPEQGRVEIEVHSIRFE